MATKASRFFMTRQQNLAMRAMESTIRTVEQATERDSSLKWQPWTAWRFAHSAEKKATNHESPRTLPTWTDDGGKEQMDLSGKTCDLQLGEKPLIQRASLHMPLLCLKHGQSGCDGHVFGFLQDTTETCNILPQKPNSAVFVWIQKARKNAETGEEVMKIFAIRWQKVIDGLVWSKNTTQNVPTLWSTKTTWNGWKTKMKWSHQLKVKVRTSWLKWRNMEKISQTRAWAQARVKTKDTRKATKQTKRLELGANTLQMHLKQKMWMWLMCCKTQQKKATLKRCKNEFETQQFCLEFTKQNKTWHTVVCCAGSQFMTCDSVAMDIKRPNKWVFWGCTHIRPCISLAFPGRSQSRKWCAQHKNPRRQMARVAVATERQTICNRQNVGLLCLWLPGPKTQSEIRSIFHWLVLRRRTQKSRGTQNRAPERKRRMGQPHEPLQWISHWVVQSLESQKKRSFLMD